MRTGGGKHRRARHSETMWRLKEFHEKANRATTPVNRPAGSSVPVQEGVEMKPLSFATTKLSSALFQLSRLMPHD